MAGGLRILDSEQLPHGLKLAEQGQRNRVVVHQLQDVSGDRLVHLDHLDEVAQTIEEFVQPASVNKKFY